MPRQPVHFVLISAVGVATTFAGCATPDTQPQSVETAWARRADPDARSGSYASRTASSARSGEPAAQSAESGRGEVAATVDGRAIQRGQMVDLLVRGHGPRVLEVLIGIELAQAEAARRGLTVSQADIENEWNRALTAMLDPLSLATPRAMDRNRADQVLQAVLAERNVSREEFGLVILRNAHLRKIVESERTFTEEQLRAEFESRFGTRVQIRHIQLATLADVARVRQRLAAGEDFGELAEKFSANMATARAGGRLDPFSRHDRHVPRILRDAAFSISPGEVAGPIRTGEWFHLIRLERILEPQHHSFQETRKELERSLRERGSDEEMFTLLEKLFNAATIEVFDPALGEVFDRRRPATAP